MGIKQKYINTYKYKIIEGQVEANFKKTQNEKRLYAELGRW